MMEACKSRDIDRVALKRCNIVGGGWNDGLFNGPMWIGPVFLPELYTPGASTSRWLAPPNPGVGTLPPQVYLLTPRVYHAVAVLLPNGAVFVAGGEQLAFNRNFTNLNMANSRWSGEIYFPPYFSQSPKPRILKCPDQILMADEQQPEPFRITVDAPESLVGDIIDRVVLIRPASVTHHFDNDQRYIELAFTQNGSLPGSITLDIAPPLSSLGPAGYYMLFVVLNGWRIPSEACWIRFL